MRKIKTTLVVTCQVPGFHYWPAAPAEHSYLRNLHRHLFHFKIFVTTSGKDREIEFINFKQNCQTYVEQHLLFSPTSASCELLAETLLSALSGMGFNVTRVECWEDGENGAIVEVAR